jgi:leucyl-tRNA synthetase
MDNIEFRSAYTEIYYNSISELKWYIERGGKNQMVVRELLENIALMTSPIMPHFSEEMWHLLGNATLSSQEKWPTSNADMINEKEEKIEDIISGTIEDMNNVIALSSKIDANKGKKIKEIKIILADDWKRNAVNSLIENKEMSKVIREQEFADIDKEKMSKYLSQFMPKLLTLYKMPDITTDELYSAFLSSRDYMKKTQNAEITVEKEAVSKSPRAARATTTKPSIEVIWA